MTLPYQHGGTQIQGQWQRTTEQALESGRHPLLEAGMDRQLLYSLPVLFSLAAWERSRRDVTEPIMMTGGVDALWPVPLLFLARVTHRQPPADDHTAHSGDEATAAETPLDARANQNELYTTPLQLLYGGADDATYLASLSTQARYRLQSGTLYAVDLPAVMQPILSPLTQPHVRAIWQNFPLALVHTATVAQASLQSSGEADLAPAHGEPWLTWAALTVVLLLVVLALLI